MGPACWASRRSRRGRRRGSESGGRHSGGPSARGRAEPASGERRAARGEGRGAPSGRGRATFGLRRAVGRRGASSPYGKRLSKPLKRIIAALDRSAFGWPSVSLGIPGIVSSLVTSMRDSSTEVQVRPWKSASVCLKTSRTSSGHSPWMILLMHELQFLALCHGFT